MLDKEFQYFQEHQDELVREYRGKYIVIKDQEVLGAYGSEMEAYQTTVQDHEAGTFLIQRVEPGEDAYTQTFHSRVVVQ